MKITDLTSSSAFWVAVGSFVTAIVTGFKIPIPQEVLTTGLALVTLIFTTVAVNRAVEAKRDREEK